MNLNLKMTVERSKRRSYFLSLVFITSCFDSRVNMHLLPSDYISNRVNVGFNMLKVTWNTITTECFLGKEHFVKTASFFH